MAYRRRQPISRASTFKDDSSPSPFDDEDSNTNKARFSRFSTFGHGSARADSSSSPSLAAQAIRASSAHRDSSLSSAYGDSAYRESNRQRSQEDSKPYEYTSMKSLNEPNKDGFWGVLARKAKSILEDDNIAQKFDTTSRNRPQMHDTSTTGQFHLSYQSPESNRKEGSPKFQKGLDAITSSLNYIGGTIGNALEEGLTIVESRTADIISETRKLQIRRKGCDADEHNQDNNSSTSPRQTLQNKTDQETQLKASRDVAMAMAAKAKLLLRELKTVKADLAFAKQRSSQLEEENKRLRDSCEKGGSPEDDDLIRLQLETLLAEKARLAHENSIYARENRFLREIVEYHQLTMQDVIYVDEGIDEVTEVCPIPNAPILDVRPITPPGPTQLDVLLMSSSTGPEVIPSHPDPKRQSSPIPDEDPKRQSSPNPAEGPIEQPSPNPSRDPKRQRSPSPGI